MDCVLQPPLVDGGGRHGPLQDAGVHQDQPVQRVLEGGLVANLVGDNGWMDTIVSIERTPVGRAGEDLQGVGVDVHHCLVVGTPQPMEGGEVTKTWTKLNNIVRLRIFCTYIYISVLGKYMISNCIGICSCCLVLG